MSRRTFPRVPAAGLLVVAALTATPPPAPAQCPNPWRGTAAPVANPWRGEVAPAPLVVELGLGWAIARPVADEAPTPRPVTAAPCCGTDRCPTARPQPAPVAGKCDCAAHPADAVVAKPCHPCPACPAVPTALPAPMPVRATAVRTVVVAPAPATAPTLIPNGTWYRELPGMVAAVTFAGSELKAVLTLNAGGALATVTLTADYAVTKDGTVHGVITGADVEMSAGKEPVGGELAELSSRLQPLVDQPFAFRCRPTDGGLMVSNLRCGGQPGMAELDPSFGMLAGKYKSAANGSVPTPKPAPIVNVYSSDPNVRMQQPVVAPPPPGVVPRELDKVTLPCQPVYGGMTLPSPRYLEQCPQYFPPAPAMACPTVQGCPGQPVVISGPYSAPCPVAGVPAGCPVAPPIPYAGSCPPPSAPVLPPAVECPTPQVAVPESPPTPADEPKPARKKKPKTGKKAEQTLGALVGGAIGTQALGLGSPERYDIAGLGEVLSGFAAQGMNHGTQPAQLGLRDVVLLAECGAGDEVVLNQIRNTGSTYTLSVADIRYLKANGVSDRVIVEMQNCGPQPPPHLTPERIHGGIMLNERNFDLRMEQLLFQAEDFRQIHEGRPQFRFQDRPSLPIPTALPAIPAARE